MFLGCRKPEKLEKTLVLPVNEWVRSHMLLRVKQDTDETTYLKYHRTLSTLSKTWLLHWEVVFLTLNPRVGECRALQLQLFNLIVRSRSCRFQGVVLHPFTSGWETGLFTNQTASSRELISCFWLEANRAGSRDWKTTQEENVTHGLFLKFPTADLSSHRWGRLSPFIRTSGEMWQTFLQAALYLHNEDINNSN